MAQLSNLINGVLKLDAGAPAIEFQERWFTWGELEALKSAVERCLLYCGPGTRVGVLIRNRPESIAALLACISAGATIVTLNPVYPDDKLADDILGSGAPVLLGAREDWRRSAVRSAAARSGALALEIAIGAEPAEVDGVQARAISEFEHAYAPGVSVEMLTSGTTGKPKRIPLRTEAFERSVLSALTFEKGRNEDDAPRLRSGVQFLTAPMAHIGGLMAMLNAIIAGRKAFLLERFELTSFAGALTRHRPKVVSTPPAALRMLLDADLPRESFASLSAWRTGTAPLDPDLADAFFETYGVPVLQNYGATEFGGVAGWTLADFKAHRIDKRGAVGRLNPGVSGRAVDADTGAVLAHDAPGVLELNGPQILDGEAWLRTTDLARVDADGFLFILGRADGAIVRGGFKVHPEDIIAALEQHEAVLEVAVAALPDARLGQVPVAAYRLKRNASDPGAQALAGFLRERLAPYQIPIRFLCIGDFPRTISMKVSQTDLRALFEADDMPAKPGAPSDKIRVSEHDLNLKVCEVCGQGFDAANAEHARHHRTRAHAPMA